MNVVVRPPKPARVETWAEIKQRMNDEFEAAILDLAAAGNTLTSTAELLGINRITLRNFIGRNGTCVKFARKPYASEELDTRLERRRALSKRGLTVTEAAKIERIGHKAMWEYSEIHGIEWKPQPRWV